ncbi:MAG: ribosome silencing factor [Eubacterium sp.]|nr:ribosome silencing factor [Eubacterium sp.]
MAFDALDEKLGKDLEIIDISKVSVMTDYLVLATGGSSTQIGALVDQVEERMAQAGFKNHRIEGNKSSNWILMDYGDLVVHVFSKEDRAFYNIEKIWMDGERKNRSEL